MESQFTFKQAINLPNLVDITSVVVCKHETVYVTFASDISSEHQGEYTIEYCMMVDDNVIPTFCVTFEGTLVLVHSLMDHEETNLAKTFFENAKLLEVDNVDMTNMKNINTLTEIYAEAERNVNGDF